MKFTCSYSSGQTYGLGRPSSKYSADVKSSRDGLEIRFRFRDRPPGLAGGGDASVASVSLDLGREEALQLAASIVAFVHHPSTHGLPARWTTPEAMPEQPEQAWAGKLQLDCRFGDMAISVRNDTHMHIGVVDMKITCEVWFSEEDEPEEHTVQVRRVLDLPPAGLLTIHVGDAFQFKHLDYSCRLMSVELINVTGLSWQRDPR